MRGKQESKDYKLVKKEQMETKAGGRSERLLATKSDAQERNNYAWYRQQTENKAFLLHKTRQLVGTHDTNGAAGRSGREIGVAQSMLL